MLYYLDRPVAYNIFIRVIEKSSLLLQILEHSIQLNFSSIQIKVQRVKYLFLTIIRCTQCIFKFQRWIIKEHET